MIFSIPRRWAGFLLKMTFHLTWFLISVLSSELLQQIALYAFKMAIENILICDLITRQSIAMNLTLQFCGLVFLWKIREF